MRMPSSSSTRRTTSRKSRATRRRTGSPRRGSCISSRRSASFCRTSRSTRSTPRRTACSRRSSPTPTSSRRRKKKEKGLETPLRAHTRWRAAGVAADVAKARDATRRARPRAAVAAGQDDGGRHTYDDGGRRLGGAHLGRRERGDARPRRRGPDVGRARRRQLQGAVEAAQDAHRGGPRERRRAVRHDQRPRGRARQAPLPARRRRGAPLPPHRARRQKTSRSTDARRSAARG
mmetsp:Transcript_5828/g.24317  ORF Transcript_5828/g.24317 Transcript_5828/m.24317 type:complete len:233 (+) Transcript_5828:420-1118(+)